MLSNCRRLMKKLYIKLLIQKADAYSVGRIYRKYYGVTIGKNVRFTGRMHWGSEPYLVEIGDNVTVANNVFFNTHDGGVSLFREKYPGVNVFGRIKIGNNVFVGNNTVFLPGVEIGDNVVIGAGSVVSRNIPGNCVVAGVPVKMIKDLAEYKKNILKKCMFIENTEPSKRKMEILSKLSQLGEHCKGTVMKYE